MANPGMRHAYTSTQPDPVDTSLVGKTKWNDRHYFLEDDGTTAAGTLGDLPYRGTAGLSTLLTGAAGVLTSAGSGNVPAWTMTPSLTTVKASTSFGSATATGTLLTNDTQTVADNAAILLGVAPKGLLVVLSTADAGSGMFVLFGAGNSVAEMTAFDTTAIYTATKDTASSINVYYDAAGGSGAGYYLQNKRGGSRDIRLIRLGS